MATLQDHGPWRPTVVTMKGRVCKADLSSAFPPLCQKANWFCNYQMQRTGNAINFMKTCSVMECLLPAGAPSPHSGLGQSHSTTKTILPTDSSGSLLGFACWILEGFPLDPASWLSLGASIIFSVSQTRRQRVKKGQRLPTVHSEAGAEEGVPAPPASDFTAFLVPLKFRCQKSPWA